MFGKKKKKAAGRTSCVSLSAQEKGDGKKLRILAASDLHGLSVVSRDLAKRAEKEHVDLVVIAGDFLNFGDYSKDMIKPFVEKNIPVVFVPGNHDTPEAVENFSHAYHAKNIHGSYKIVNDVGFFGSGGSSNLPYFPFSVTEKEMYNNLKMGYEKIRNARKKIMVTHEHPSGTLVEKFSSIPGSKSVKKAIDKFQPDIFVCGHIHEMEGFEERLGKTRVIVLGKRGAIIEI